LILMAQGIEGFIPYINRKPLSDPLFLERARNPQDFPVLTSKEGGRDIYETHRMAHKAVQDSEGNIRGIAFPNIIFDGKELVNLPKRGINPADYALETGNYKLFDTVSEARDFAMNYKDLPEFEALKEPRNFNEGGVAGFIPLMLGFPPEPSMDQMRENYQKFAEDYKEDPGEALRQAASVAAIAAGRSPSPPVKALGNVAQGGLRLYDYFNPDDGLVPDTGIGVPPPTDPSSTPGFDLLSNVYGMIGGKKATDYGPAVDRGKELEAQGESPIDIANKTEEEFGVRAVRDDDGEFKIEIPTSSFTTDITGTFMTYGERLNEKMIRDEKRVVDIDQTTKYTKLMLDDVLPPDAFRPGYTPSKFAKTPFRTANLQIMPDIYERTKSGKYKLVQQSPFRTIKGSEGETIFHIQHNKMAGSNKTITRAENPLTALQIEALPADLQHRVTKLKEFKRIPKIINVAKTQEDLIQLGVPRLSEVLDYPQLYKQYPELANTPILRGEDKKAMLEQRDYGATGHLYGGKDERFIIINDHSSKKLPAPNILIELLKTIVHETQHNIQKKEGMAPGGSVLNAYSQIAKFTGVDFLEKLPPTLQKGIAASLYNALGGEVDARLVEARLEEPDLQLTETFTETRAGEAIGLPLVKRTIGRPEEGSNVDMTNYRDLLFIRDLIKQKEDKYLKNLALFEGDTSYIGKFMNEEGKYYKKPHKTFTEKFEEKIKEGIEEGTIKKPAQQDMFPENFEDGGVVGYFKRPEIDGMLYPSEFEKDVTEKPGYEYGMILPISSNVETGETQFDLAGGITGGIGRGIATLDRAFGGIPTTEQDVMNAALEVVGPSSGIAGITAGPGQLPGLIGAFNLKHGSGALFDKLRSSETGAAGPGVYGFGAEDTNAALGYAISRAKNEPLKNDDTAYEYKEMYEDPSEGSNVIYYLLETGNFKTFRDKTTDTTSFIFSDGSMVKVNRALSDEEIDYDNVREYGAEDLKKEIDSGELKLTFEGEKQGYLYDLAIKETKDDFFDFNKPLKDQPSKHRQALLELAEKTGYDLPVADLPGGYFYQHLEELYGSDDAASKKLSELGFIGNKTFLGLNDEAYVVFDPDKVEIKGYEVVNFENGGVAGLASIAQNMFTN
jgi:hypothetical protein